MMREVNKSNKVKETVLVKPVAPEEKDLSGLMERHSYTVDKEAVDPSLLSSPKKDISRPLINKNINKMRLRPRQVLCSMCKKGMNTKNLDKNSKQSHRKENKAPQDLSSTGLQYGKRKHGSSNEHPMQKLVKSSPAIKISFASPKGVGTVLKIPPRPSTPAPSDSEYSQDNSESTTESPIHKQQEEYVSEFKSAKRDKVKRKQMTSLCGGNNILIASANLKKDKHIKHKIKRKETKTSKSKKNQKSKFFERDKQREGSNSLSKENRMKSSHKSVIEKKSLQLSPVQGHQPLKCKVVLEKLDRQSLSHSNSSSNVCNSNSNETLKYNALKSSGKNFGQNSSEHSGNVDSTRTVNDKEYDYRDYFEDITDSDDSTSLQIDESSGVQPLDAEIDENTAPVRPLTIKIQTHKVSKIELDDGRSFHEGDVIWGKISGFPWWPGRITAIYESMKDFGVIIAQNAHISWFGSSTVSVKPCSELYPFLQYYKEKFSKKKRGTYKLAIKQAMCIANSAAASEMSPASDISHSTPSSQVPEVHSFCGESEEALLDVTSTISNENIDLINSTHEPEVSSSVVQGHDGGPASLPSEGSQEVPNESIDIIQHSSSEHHSEIYDDDVNFEIDESQCVAPSEVFRNVHFHNNEKHYEEESDLEEGEILSDSNE